MQTLIRRQSESMVNRKRIKGDLRPKAQRSTRFEEEEREEQLETNGSVSHKQQYQVVHVEPTFLGTGRNQKE